MLDAKYKVALIAHRNINDEAKDVTYRNSICNIKNIEELNELLDDQSFYKGSGAWFDMNDRMDIYLGWYKEKIEEKLAEDYEVNIVELHKSYGNQHIEDLKNMEKELENRLQVLDTELL